MAEVNQYVVSNKELAELIIKSAGVSEGRWVLIANFVFAPGNFGPTPVALSPGVAVILQSVGIQRVLPEMNVPLEIVVDAAEITRGEAPAPKSRKTKSA